MPARLRWKLKALDAALKAGKLTAQEHARKRAKLLATAPAGATTRFRDPRERFELRYPVRWQLKPLAGDRGLALTHGNAAGWLLVEPDTADAQKLLASVVGRMRAKWRAYARDARWP